jgi:hypothetical protein
MISAIWRRYSWFECMRVSQFSRSLGSRGSFKISFEHFDDNSKIGCNRQPNRQWSMSLRETPSRQEAN